MDRKDLEVIDLGIASVETRGALVGEPEQFGREIDGNGISED